MSASVSNAVHRVARFVRLGLATAWYRSGLWLLWKLVVLRRRAVVLMYHRVLPVEARTETWSHPGIVVTRETFERQMRLVRRWFRPLTLDEFVSRLQSRQPFESGCCLVTFDDGWYDTYSEAWPVLRRHGIPAVVFLPVNFIGSDQLFWQERLGALLFEAWRRSRTDADLAARVRAVLAPAGLGPVLEVRGDDARAVIVDYLRAGKRTTEAGAPAVMATLESILGSGAGIPTSVDRFMTWDHVREMARDGVSFGAHGVTHRLLTTLSAPEVQAEVTGSRDEIARRLDTDVTAFCYPSGEWNASVSDMVRKGGFSVAFATSTGQADVGSEPFAVHRVNIHEDMTRHPSMFLARVLDVL